MTPSPPTRTSRIHAELVAGARREAVLLGAERNFAVDIEDGLERVEEGLARRDGVRRRPRRRHQPLPARRRRQARPADAHAAGRAARRGHNRRRHHRPRRPSRSPTSPRSTTTTSWTRPQLRRGVPSAQTKSGATRRDPDRRPALRPRDKLVAGLGERGHRLQAETFERLCLGQLHETIGPREGDDPIEHYLHVLADKTGSLISMAAKVGVMFSDAPREYLGARRRRSARRSASPSSSSTTSSTSRRRPTDTGKRAGTDLLAGVETLPLLYLRQEAQTDIASAALLSEIEATSRRRSPVREDDDADLHDTVDAAARARRHPSHARRGPPLGDDSRRRARAAARRPGQEGADPLRRSRRRAHRLTARCLTSAPAPGACPAGSEPPGTRGTRHRAPDPDHTAQHRRRVNTP